MADEGKAEVRSKVWVERDGVVLLSEWRIALLEAVASEGSLARAADLVGVPYRTAWQRIRDTESRLGMELIQTESGGPAGGSSRITPAAEDLIARYRRLTRDIKEELQRRFAVEFGDFLSEAVC